MEQLKINLVNTNTRIQQLKEKLANAENNATMFKEAFEKAKCDNDEKNIFDTACSTIRTFTPSHIMSVNITEEDLKPVIDALKVFSDKLHSVEVKAEDQKVKYDEYEKETISLRESIKENEDLKVSYKLQLSVEIKKAQNELNELKKLIDDQQ